MTPAEASAILDREHEAFLATYQDPPPPADGGTWTPFALAVAKHAAWEQRAVAVLTATGEDIDDTPGTPEEPRDTSAWYDRNIAATQRRIARNERRIAAWENRPTPDRHDPAEINLPLKVRQRGMATEVRAWKAYDAAVRDLPAARARLARLQDNHPHAQDGTP